MFWLWGALKDVLRRPVVCMVAGLVVLSYGMLTAAAPPLLIIGLVLVGVPLVMHEDERRAIPPPVEDVPEDEIFPETPVIWCVCGSQAEAVPVEVDYADGKGMVTVAELCPDCREKRKDFGTKMLEREQAFLAKADTGGTIILPEGVERVGVSGYDYRLGGQNYTRLQAAKIALREKMAQIDALAAGWKAEGDDTLSLSAKDHADYMYLVNEITALKDLIEAEKAEGVREALGLSPKQPQRRCEDIDHEWISVVTDQSDLPVRAQCLTCGADWRTAEQREPQHRVSGCTCDGPRPMECHGNGAFCSKCSPRNCPAWPAATEGPIQILGVEDGCVVADVGILDVDGVHSNNRGYDERVQFENTHARPNPILGPLDVEPVEYDIVGGTKRQRAKMEREQKERLEGR